MESIWQETKLPSFPRLDRDIRTDVLIIGGGLAGLLTAYQLQKNHVDCVVLERDRICGWTSGNTTAKITAQHGLIYHRLMKEVGPEKTLMYLDANLAACREYGEMCREIPCDYQERDNYVYAVEDAGMICRELDALGQLHYPATFHEKLPIPVKIAGAVSFSGQAQVNPLKLASAIAGGMKIYEASPVMEMIGSTAVTPGGRVRATEVIVTTHFPFINKHGSYFLKLYQHRSYVIALKNAADVDGMYVDEDHAGFSFRNYGEYLLLGGGGHRTGKPGGGWQQVRDFARAHYPGAQEAWHWAAQDCMSLDGIPYIGRYSKGTKNLYVATGFNKWGLSSSMVSAMLLRDRILGRENPYEKVFDPSRSILRPQLAANGWESLCGLLTLSKKRCPHLGCALKWNPQEHSWDCPCHGSRFSGDGKLLNNPANGDLKEH